MSCDTEERGGPFIEVEPKRSFDNVPVQVDWHDYLINLRKPGAAYALNQRVRPRRAEATGLQYRCTAAGVTSRVPSIRIAWPTTAGLTVTDGTVVWTAEVIDANSLRSPVQSDDWPAVTGLTFGTESVLDLVYTLYVDGGADGETYEVKHRITLANGEEKEALILLPVKD